MNYNKDEIKEFLEKMKKENIKHQDRIEHDDALFRLRLLMKTYAGEDRIVSSLDIWETLKTRPEEHKILSGFKGLDEITGGFRPKQLVVLSAATKSGKTSFCIELTSRAKNEAPTWFPFEEPAEELLQKFMDRGDTPPLFYTPIHTSGSNLQWIEKKIVESIVKFNTRLVFIDHLHFIIPPGSDDINQRIGNAMRELKRLAVKLDVTIVLIAHLRKTDLEKQPTLDDLRDSSFIAQEADTVIIMWRKAKRENGELIITNDVNISVQANRRTGKTGNIKMLFKDGHFYEEDWQHQSTGEILEWNA